MLDSLLKYQPIKCQCCLHIETSQLICTSNQLTGFYIRLSLAFTGLIIRYSSKQRYLLHDAVNDMAIFQVYYLWQFIRKLQQNMRTKANYKKLFIYNTKNLFITKSLFITQKITFICQRLHLKIQTFLSSNHFFILLKFQSLILSKNSKIN